MTQPTAPESTAFPDGNEIETLRVLRAIHAELVRQGAMLERAMAFVDNPVSNYLKGMKRGRRDAD